MNGGYEATPVERAYSLYLVHQVFGILLPLPNHNVVNIPGRNAVPFLTQSGVDRGILRSIWSVADPQNFGSLTNIAQFHVLLRLVAMAQAGIIVMDVSQQQQQQQHAIQMSLQQCASRHLPLAVFSGVAVPQPDALMAMYGSYLVVVVPQPTLPAGFSAEPKALQSVDDAFGGIVPVEDAPLPSLGAFAAPVEPETTTTAAAAVTASSFQDNNDDDDDDDDFGDFGSAPTPAPILDTPSSIGGTPSMMITSVVAEATTKAATASAFQDNDDDDDDFGDFGSAPTPTPTPDDPSLMMTSDANTSNFQTNNPIFESSPSQLPSSATTTTTTMQQPFVTDFGRALSEPIAATTPSMVVPTSMSVSDAFGDLDIPVTDAPLPSLDAFGRTTTTSNENGGMAMNAQEIIDDDDDDFGTFETAAASTEANTTGSLFGMDNNDNGFEQPSLLTEPSTTTTTTIADTGTSLSITNAFSDIPIQQDAPLPSLTPMNPTGAVMEDEDDDFGGFEEAEASAEPTTTFDVGITESGFQPEGDNGGTDSDDDDFGDFGGASEDPPQPEPDLLGFDAPAIPRPPAMTDIGRTASEPIQSTLGMDPNTGSQGHARSASIDDAFGDFLAPQDAPLPSLEMLATITAPALEQIPTNSNDLVSSNGDDDEDFGDFEGEMQAPVDHPTPTDNNDDDDDEFGDFGAAPATNDTPVNPQQTDLFGSQDASDNQHDVGITEPGFQPEGDNGGTDSDDDDFGDFGGASEDPPQPEPDLLGFDAPAIPRPPAMTDIGRTASEPIQSTLGMDPNTGSQGHARSVSIDDAFGDFSAPQDAPLPSLEMLAATTAPALEQIPTNSNDLVSSNGDDDEDFGDFEGEMQAPVDHLTPTDNNDDDDDEFGDFGAAPAANDTPVNPQQTDLFGSQDASDNQQKIQVQYEITGSATPSLSITDPFDAMPTNDAPLPSLDMLGAPTNVPVQSDGVGSTSDENDKADDDDEDDDFGGFETAPNVPITKNIENTSEPFASTELGSEILDTKLETTSDADPFGSEMGPVSAGSSIPAVTDTGPSLSIADAFGDLEVADAPLPALIPTGQDPSEDKDAGGNLTSNAPLSILDLYGGPPADTMVTTDGGDLLGFSGAEQQVAGGEVPSQVETDEFGDFGVATPIEQDKSEEVDDFGAFGGAQPVNTVEQLVNNTLSTGVDDFGVFGSAGIVSPSNQDVQEDDFGDFGGANVESTGGNEFDVFGSAVATNSPEEDVQEEDSFGDFGGANVESTGGNEFDFLGSTDATNPPAEDVQEEDDFGDFGGAAVNVESTGGDDFGAFGNSDVKQTSEEDAQEVDDFGDFGSAANNVESTAADNFGMFGSANVQTPSMQDVKDIQTKEEDDFGDFGSAELTAPMEQDGQPEGEDDFGDFGSAGFPTPPEQNPSSSRPEDFGSFDDFGSTDIGAPVEQKVDDVQPPVEEEDFGDFGSAEFVSSGESDNDKLTSEEDIEEFGDFNVVEAPQNVPSESEAGFGDFSTFQDAFSNDTSQLEQAGQSSPANNDMKNDDWGDFEDVRAPSVESIAVEEIKIRDRIRSLALQLSQSVLRKSGVSGDHVDLGEAFEVNVGIKSSMTGSNRRRAYRCIRVLESLTSKDNSKLASTFWVQIFNVVNEELVQAKILLTEAESFSSNEWSEIKAPLSVMIQGIAEYMRVTRSILASIGDLLLLDESAILTVDTWVSTWCSLSILEKALEGETKWKEIQKQLTTTPLPMVTLPTIQEIRSDATRSQVGPTDTLCHLTFQPLRKKDKSTTKEEVSFQGKRFMACSANFLANRCPFFVVGEEV